MNKNSPTYPEVLRKFRQRSNLAEVLEEIENQLSIEIKSLHLVKACLSLGTGYGEYDIEFIKRCLPSLKKLIVVEKDPNCLRELKVNMKNAFGDKIEIEIHESKIEDFMNKIRNHTFKIDLILAFYVLYFLTPEIREDLFNLCFNQWLELNSGMLVFINPSKESDFSTLYNRINIELFQDVERMKNEIKALDMDIIIDKKCSSVFDFRDFDFDLYGMMKAIKPDTAEELIKNLLEEVCPDGILHAVCRLFVVQRNKSISNSNGNTSDGLSVPETIYN